MSKEVAKVVETAVSTISQEAWGDTPMSSNDLVIPKIVLMQPGSSLVVDGLAKFGDFLNTMTKEVVGNMLDGIEIVPFHMHKMYHIMKKNGADFEFSHYQEINAIADETLPWEFVENGEEFKRVFVYQFFIIVPKLGKMPFAITLKSTARRTGKELATQMYVINKAQQRSPAGTTIKLFGVKTKNEKGLTYGALSVLPLRGTDIEIENEAFGWFKILKTQKVKVADDVETEATPAQQNLAF